MPELPEVETTRAGIEPHIINKKISGMLLRRRDLRWPVTPALPDVVKGQYIEAVLRRGKYLILQMQTGVVLSHLGMSGSLRIAAASEAIRKHDHWDLCFDSTQVLRFNDPRRFGALFWEESDWQDHELIRHLGPEPLSADFDADYLYKTTRDKNSKAKKLAIKNHIMDSKTVVGVGNIYAAESLFHAGIHPAMSAGKLSKKRAGLLVTEIKRVLAAAIESGGTTLRDYVNGNGQPGYFQQELWIYGREGQPCKTCGEELKGRRMGQRATVFCPSCQKR